MDDYDARVPAAWRSAALAPGARTAILLASGGRALWSAFRRAPEWGRGPDPLDAYTARVAREAADHLAAAGHPSRALCAHEPRGGHFADFVALGAAAGLGAPGRLGLLLHPRYGPWLSLRAVLLCALAWRAPAEAPAGFDPCTACHAPCQRACPGAAPAPAGFDLGRCRRARQVTPDCARSCAARTACVLGPDAAYAPEALAHHMGAVRLP